MSDQQSIIHPHQPEHCPHCAALATMRQSIMDFTGRVDKATTFDEFKAASKGLYSETKKVKVSTCNDE